MSVHLIGRFGFLLHKFLSVRGKYFLGTPVKFCVFDQSVAVSEPCPAEGAAVGLLSLQSVNES